MDVVSHGLWGGTAFGRKNKKSFLAGVAFGMLPDIIPFGPFFLATLFGSTPAPNWHGGHADVHTIPTYVFSLYQWTHSLVIFGIVFLLVWAFYKKPFVPMFAWGLHIVMDIPTHVAPFFPTPFLWPFSSYTVSGIAWIDPIIFIPNVLLLAWVYAVWYHDSSRRGKRMIGGEAIAKK